MNRWTAATRPSRFRFVNFHFLNFLQQFCKTSTNFQGDDAMEEKRNRRLAQGRPYLLRRSTMSNTGSFKRRSLKLRRSHRESRRGGDQSDAESIKRSDSIRSKRKVSSISDRSDISDVPMDHDISGEESPGILSDDGQHESPSDGAADIEEGISTRGMPWLRVKWISISLM
jgi:hypothetical protein